MRTWKWYSKVLLALVILAFAYFVWPTPWTYYQSGMRLLRVHRITEQVQRSDREGGWVLPNGLDPELAALARKKIRRGPTQSADELDRAIVNDLKEGLTQIDPEFKALIDEGN